MYRIYSTEGIVLKSTDTGEASKFLSLFTKDLGLLYARVQGIRKESSKLRYHVQDFSCASWNLVRGKNGWRVTSAYDAEILAEAPAFRLRSEGARKEAMRMFLRTRDLLERLLHGEREESQLFSDVVAALSALKKDAVPEDALKDFEALFVMRILSRLGYWGEDPVLAPFLTSFNIDEPHTFSVFRPVRGRAIRRINASLLAAQL